MNCIMPVPTFWITSPGTVQSVVCGESTTRSRTRRTTSPGGIQSIRPESIQSCTSLDDQNTTSSCPRPPITVAKYPVAPPTAPQLARLPAALIDTRSLKSRSSGKRISGE